MATRFWIFQGNLAPSIADVIMSNGAPVDLTTATGVTLSIRPAGSAAVSITRAATVVTALTGNVRFDWQAGDTATAGDYAAWWTVTWPGAKTQDTPEFDLLVATHTPDPLTTQSGPVAGPCSSWCTADDVERFCSGVTDASAPDRGPDYASVAFSASSILYELSARLFSGACPKTVRPCSTTPCGWGGTLGGGWNQYLPWSWTGYGWGWGADSNDQCGCGYLNQIDLAGYPVRTVTQVKVDGNIIPLSQFRLDNHRLLVWLDDATLGPRPWPACQNVALPDTAVGTFSITYTAGEDPPQLGRDAAAELACHLKRASSGQRCGLPQGVTKIVRQGVSIDKGLIANFQFFSRSTRGGQSGWQTGLVHVDAFLNTYNPQGVRRRAAVWSPNHTYPRRTS